MLLLKKSVLFFVCLALLLTAVSAQASTSVSDDFESYGAFAASANNGNKWFHAGAADNDGSYETGNWGPMFLFGSEREPPQVSASGGSAGSIGLTNFDSTASKGTSRALPAIPNLAAGETAEMSVHVDLSGQAAAGRSYLFIGTDTLGDGSSPNDQYAGISMNANGGGNMLQATLGPEPAITLGTDAAGWTEIKLVIEQRYHDGYEFDTTHLDVFSGPVGGTLEHRGTYGANMVWTPTTIGLGPNLGSIYDNLTLSVVPEPASLSMLLLGAGLMFVRRRR
ncbi:MAG: PEP-CTERM sorting domain-containing protein [Pirellulaceae bacterium]|nr:PEP-CTERM sorting domain-containing protein [Pirellulaceae bacterium]